MKAFVLVLLFYSNAIFAQPNTKSIFSLKATTGLSGCQIHGDSYNGYHKVGYTLGLVINASVSKRSSFDLGILYATKGSKHNPTDYNPSYYYLNLRYIEMPLYWHFFFTSKYFFTLGLYGGYLINYYENQDYTDVTGWYDYNKFDMGLVTGIGRKLSDNFHVELRFTNSLIPIRNISSNTYYENPIARFFDKGYYNNVVVFLLAYKFDLNKHAN